SDPAAALGSQTNPYRRVTDAMLQARLIRYGDAAHGVRSSAEFITVHVGPGTYTGTTVPATAGMFPALENWPVLVNLANFALIGSTKLFYDDDTNPLAKHLPTGSYSTETKLDVTGTELLTSGSIILLQKTVGGEPISNVSVHGFVLLAEG